MGALVFPSTDTVRLALVSGVIAPAVANSPVRAGQDRAGQWWISPFSSLPPQVDASLNRLGASYRRLCENLELRQYQCWHQLLPLAPIDMVSASGNAVLFEIPDHLAMVVAAEIQRVAPGCQEISLIIPQSTDAAATVFVQVVDPPLFTMLRAQTRADVRIFVEQAPRVWISAGWRHPLESLLTPPVDASFLIQSDGQWRQMPGILAPSRAKEFHLAGGGEPLRLTAASSLPAIPMPLRLVAASSRESPHIWVVDEEPMEQLQALVESTSAAALARWEVAVVTAGARKAVLFRSTGGTSPPGELLVRGTGYVPYLRMSNLFVPVGMMLHPALRRDQARRWLSADDSFVTLLQLNAGQIEPTRFPMRSFQPLLPTCVHEVPQRTRLQPVPIRTPLPFELFSIAVEPIRLTPLQSAVPIPAAAPAATVGDHVDQPGLLARLRRLFQAGAAPAATGLSADDALEKALPNQPLPAAVETVGRRLKHQQRRAELEERLLQFLEPEHASARAALWPQLAGAHTDLGQFTDASACWLNALWHCEKLPGLWLRGWLQAEKMLSRIPLLEDDLQRLLDMAPSPATVRTLAAVVVWSANTEKPNPMLLAQAQRIQRRLETHENWLPIRAAWLAQCSLARLTRGDILALARTRDRLVERLLQTGLSLEQDVPSFMRFTGREAGEKLPSVRDWLQRTRDIIHRWIDLLVTRRPAGYALTIAPAYLDQDGNCTKAYADLLLAWGLARLGEATAARHYWQAGCAGLAPVREPEVRLLVKWFEQRIDAALDGKPASEPLPPRLQLEAQRLAVAPTDDRHTYAVCAFDTLRHALHILEPQQRVTPFRRLVLAPYLDGLEQEMAQWPGVQCPDELARRITSMFRVHTDDLSVIPGLLESALELSARLGEKRVLPLLERAEQILDLLPAGSVTMLLLEQALATAAHYQMAELGRRLASRLIRLLTPRTLDFALVIRSCRQPTPQPEILERIEHWPGRCLRYLRQLGMPAEAERLWPRLREWVLAAGSLPQVRNLRPEIWLPALRTMLNLIGDRHATVNDEIATAVLDLARKQLLYGGDMRTEDCTSLACAYVAALGRAPIRVAQGRIEELLRDLNRLHDSAQTNAHYALAPLRVVDTLVRAVVNEDFSLSPSIRRWLSHDDYAVRRRMQHDLQAVLPQIDV